MIEQHYTRSVRGGRGSDPRRRPTPPPIERWRLHGVIHDVRGLAIDTSFGYAVGLELATEVVLTLLQPTIEDLVAATNRLEAACLAHGWPPMDEGRARKEQR